MISPAIRQLLVFLTASLIACSALAQSGNAQLRIGDLLDLRISGVPADDIGQISGTYTVDNEGNLNLPYIGKVRAVGFSAGALQTSIQNRYIQDKIFTNPTVLIMTAGGGRFVNISGDVRAPQRVAFTPDMTLLKAITAAGDFTEYANRRKVRLLRGGESLVVDVKKIRDNPSLDIPLKPGDDIFVPRSWL